MYIMYIKIHIVRFTNRKGQIQSIKFGKIHKRIQSYTYINYLPRNMTTSNFSINIGVVLQG